MNLKTVGTLLMISILLMGFVDADNQQISDIVLKRLTLQLNLTAKQVSDIKPIIVANIAQREAMFKGVIDKKEIRASMVAETREISRFLDPNQIKTLNVLQDQEERR